MAKSGFAKDQLKSFINRIERLEEERAVVSADIREVYSEAKGTGFDTKIMRQVIRMRKLDKADFQEQEAMLDLYLTAMDMRDAPLLNYAEVAKDEKVMPSVGFRPATTELYDQAVAIVTADRKASVSYIQRKMQINYNTAAGLVESMERAGIVSGPDHRGFRKILGPDQEISPDSIPQSATEAAAIAGEDSDAPKGARTDAYLAGDAEAEEKRSAPEPTPQTSVAGVTGGERAAPFEIPKFLDRRPKELATASPNR